jgi:hypothetical protein
VFVGSLPFSTAIYAEASWTQGARAIAFGNLLTVPWVVELPS